VLDFVSLATARGTPRTYRYEGGERLPEVTEFTIRGADRQDVDSLMRLTAPASYDAPARIENLATVQEQDVPDGIDRRDQEYTVTVSWDYQGPPRLADEYERQVHDAFRPPPGFSVHRDDEYIVAEDESRMLALALAGAVLVMFLVLAVLYESLWHPFIVLATIPLALVGVCYLYLWTGASFTSSGYIGVILLVGIVDNNGVLLLDRISQLRRAGLSALAAATQGTLDRVRPVLLTSATTALGLLPMLWNEPGGGQPGLWSDLARSALGGLVTSSILVLAVVPSLYMAGEHLRRAARRVIGQPTTR
jgi:HAE1 family hydrophobic/amphiphilic exporter-1